MDKPPPRPTLTDRALAEKQAREAREAAALRANLLRRKQQQRARAAPAEANDTPTPPPLATEDGTPGR
jgi:hypothetical protein